MAAPPRTILVADDDVEFAKFLCEQLKEKGFKTFVASDGIGAFTLALKHHPNLVIMDYSMPAANGGTVYQRFLNAKETADIPVIFLSSMPMAKLEKSIPKKPQVRILLKPISLRDLEAAVEEMLKAFPTTGPPERPPYPFTNNPNIPPIK